MNYKAELRGFALDRAVRIAEVYGVQMDSGTVFEQADKIVEYLYIPEKDIKSLLDAVVPLIVQSGDLEKISGLILELQQLRAEMEAGLKAPVVASTPTEIV